MISLYLNKIEYENDIRALIMAFYHGEKIVVNPDRKGFMSVEVHYGTSHIQANVCGDKGEGHCRNACDFADYKETRNILKRSVYHALCEYTGRTLPWGTLTGIRPTKIAMDLLEKGKTPVQIDDYLKQEYYISGRKSNLCIQVAENEREILNDADYHNTYSLYVGIPFCPTICLYCSFSSYPINVWQDRVDDYLEALFKEIDFAADASSGKTPLTFYMGGGTPTSLSAGQLDRLLTKLDKCFGFSKIREMTVEAGRPDSVSKEKFRVIKDHGIDRISINPQTMNQKTLDIIGRKHTVEQIVDAFYMAREEGISNINMDLIAGLPGEDFTDFQYTMSEIEKLDPDNLTVHSLALKRAAALNREWDNYSKSLPEDVDAMLDSVFDKAKAMGLYPYYMYRQKNIAGNLENVGYAKKGKAGLYNILIMEEKQSIIALGAGASTKLVYHDQNRIERIENVKSVKDYIERIDEMIRRKKGNIMF